MDRLAFANWTTSAWQRLGFVVSGLWAAAVLLTALASSDPGQNYVAQLLILPIGLLWCLSWVIGRASRALRPEHEATATSLPKENPSVLWWLASALVCVAAIVGAFTLQSGPDARDVLHQALRLAGNTLVIAALASVVYIGIRPRTSFVRARFFFATAIVGAGFVLWQAFDDTKRVDLSAVRSAASESTASRDTRVAERTEKSAKRRQATVSKAAGLSAPESTVEWAAPLSEALRRNNQAYLDLASKWDAAVAELQVEAMLTPETLMSFEGRRQNRERLKTFEMLLTDYLTKVEALQRAYKEEILAIEIPESEREDFLREFERAYANSVSETKKLNAEFERVELEIAKTMLAITDLIEREGDAVTVGSDRKALLFERDAAAQEYNALLKGLTKSTDEERVVMAKSSEALRKRSDKLSSAQISGKP